MTRRSLVIAAVAAALVATAAIASSAFLRSQEAWERRAAAETARAEQALAENDSLRIEADELRGLADSYAFLAEQRDTVIIRLREEIPVAPPDCEPYTAPRDTLIAELEAQNSEVKSAFEAQREAYAVLAQAEVKARVSADSLLAVLDDRPIPKPAWIPDISVGPFAGLCIDGRPCAGVGVGLTWKVRIF